MKPHHTPTGFRNPWPGSEPHGFGDFLRWTWERRKIGRAPDPAPGTFPLATPSFPMRASRDALLATWVGHSTVLLQVDGANVLTDPMWSERASPVPFAGPKRFARPGVDLDGLPPLDVVLLSHNHYDHLDRDTVRRLAARAPDVPWLVPLRLGALLRGWGVRDVRELDWWDELEVAGLRIACTPARHFSARGVGDRNRTLWCGWALAGRTRRVLFAGDTAYHPEFATIAERYGPFDLALLPVGAYEPRWFMGSVHMNPDDALRAYRDLTAGTTHPCAMLAVHWGTFRLTDEAMTEPPERTARLWREAGLREELLWVLRHGETRQAG